MTDERGLLEVLMDQYKQALRDTDTLFIAAVEQNLRSCGYNIEADKLEKRISSLTRKWNE